VRAVTEVGMVFPRSGGTLRDLIELLRPYQWIKNALVLVPLLTAQRLDDADAVLQAALAFVAFCLVASSVYVLNDLADVVHDRHHPRKRDRPFAAGRVSLLAGWFLWPTLAVLGFALAIVLLPPLFTLALAAYLVLTTAYTFRLKRQPVLDVVALGLLYASRIVAGAAAIDVELSMWLLTFSMFFFLSLALIKRVSELTRIRRTMGQMAVQVRGRGYVETDLELLSSYGVASSVAAVVIFSLYVDDPKTSVLYATPELLWCSVPILLAWLMRMWLLAHRGTMDEDPIVFAIRDKASLLAGLLLVAVFVAAKVVTV
jgi:4-hydroxybenzoate polyprenyltransferase